MELGALADRPFDLLAALEARLAASGEAKGVGTKTAEWVGLGFKLGDTNYLAARTDVREVMEPPAVTRVPGAKPWLLGLANVRGDLLPIVDLRRLLSGEAGVRTGTSRVIVLNHEAPAGFLVDGVGGFRSFAPEEQRHELVDEHPGESGDADPADFVLGAFVRDGTAWRVFSLRKLADAPVFRDAGV